MGDKQIHRARVLQVRIHLPPAESQQTFGSARLFREGHAIARAVGRSDAQPGFLGQIFFLCQADRELSLRWIYPVHKPLYDAVVGHCFKGWAGTAEGILPSWIVLDDLYGRFKLAILDRIVGEVIVAAVATSLPACSRRGRRRVRRSRQMERNYSFLLGRHPPIRPLRQRVARIRCDYGQFLAIR